MVEETLDKACLGIIIYQVLVKSPQKFRLYKCGLKIIHEEAKTLYVQNKMWLMGGMLWKKTKRKKIHMLTRQTRVTALTKM